MSHALALLSSNFVGKRHIHGYTNFNSDVKNKT